MTNQDLNSKLDRLLALMEAQLELSRQSHREERLRRAHLAEEASIMTERSKPVATPFPKFNPRNIEIYILEAEAWFRFNQVYEHTRMINHLGSQLEGTAREWWTSKLRFDRAREGRLFNDWQFFTKRLAEQFNPWNARMEAYNKPLALRLTSDAPGAATRHVEQFRDLEGDESRLGDPNTPTPAPRPRRSVSFNKHAETNYEKYASPTGLKYLKTRVDPYSRSRMDSYVQEQEHNARHWLPSQVFEKVESGDVIGSGLQQIPAENAIASAILPISTGSVLAAGLGEDSLLVAPMLTMESIGTQGLKELAKIFQPLDPEPQGIHVKKPFEIKDGLWHSGGRLVTPKVTMPGKTNDRRSRSAREVDGQSLSVEHSRFMEISQCHDGITAGHMGRDATIKAAQRHSWWPNMAAWIADYVASHPVCARYKAPRHRPYGLLQPLATPDRPWGSVSLDFIEGLPLSEGYDSILVIVDRLTKYAILALTHKTVMAKQTALLLWKHVIRQFGCQDRMVFDRGRPATWFISIAETGRRVDPRRNWTPGLLDLTQFRKEWAIGRTGLHCRQVSVHDVFQVSMLELAKTSSLPQRSEQPVVPSLPYEDLEFEVEALIGKRTRNKTTEYKVLWRGYPEEAAP
ncbi:uncharacterized protein UDID_19464 [Ustilago sp. UG-2017a]|nr:uncharacterized protein UDID_19464 [Ustilago sp. UG-2017a]